MSVVEIHARFSNTALFYFIILSAWGYWRFFRKEGMNSNYWGAIIIAEGLLLVQVLIGVYMMIIGLRPDRTEVHIMYGVISVMALPAVYMFTKGRQERPEMLMYGTTALIAVGLIMRAMFTAGG